MEWLIPSNSQIYDVDGAFKKFGFVDWGQGNKKYQIGDIIYLYTTKPIQQITHKCKVEKINLDSMSVVDDSQFYLDKSKFAVNHKKLFMRMSLMEVFDNDLLGLNYLLANGLKTAPMGPLKINDELSSYIEHNFLKTSKVINGKISPLQYDQPDFYQKFWTGFRLHCERDMGLKSTINFYKPSNHNWYDINFGLPKYHITLRCSKQKKCVSVVFYINNDKFLFDKLYSQKLHIQNLYQHKLLWNIDDKKKACTISHSLPLSDFDSYEDCFIWLIHNAIDLFKVIHQSVDNVTNIFPDSADTEACIEGAKTTVQVNKYERSSVARQKCIDINGCYCHICGLDFQKIYGEIGEGFIHVHHKIPLNEIDEEYIVDPVNDLIPVCPNCHAMLHRKINDTYLSCDELKKLLSKQQKS